MNEIFPGWHEPTNQKWVRNPKGESTMRRVPGTERLVRVYESPVEQLRAIVGWEVGAGWHLVLSSPVRYPGWEEVKLARYDLLPDECTMAMLLPPKAEYVNVHPNCFHLYQVPTTIRRPETAPTPTR